MTSFELTPKDMSAQVAMKLRLNFFIAKTDLLQASEILNQETDRLMEKIKPAESEDTNYQSWLQKREEEILLKAQMKLEEGTKNLAA